VESSTIFGLRSPKGFTICAYVNLNNANFLLIDPAMRTAAAKAGKIGWFKIKPSNVNVMMDI
jgi:hypothetical protein